jgi:hypothetical protein
MKRLTTKWFKKWSKKVKVSNQNLLDAINDLEAGLSTVDLGNHLFKVRAIFLFGFGKNEKENINKNELQYFKKLADDLLSLNSEQLEKAISQKALFNLENTK